MLRGMAKRVSSNGTQLMSFSSSPKKMQSLEPVSKRKRKSETSAIVSEETIPSAQTMTLHQDELEKPEKRRTRKKDEAKEVEATAKKSSEKKEKKQPFVPTDGLTRCSWCLGSEIYVKYHDTEWGVPVRDDRKLFEKLSLEGAQAGLSWLTILNKREAYRSAFFNFDVARCAALTDPELEAILSSTNVVRNRTKLWSVRTNAQRTLEVQKEFGSLTKYLWGFVVKAEKEGAPTATALKDEEEEEKEGKDGRVTTSAEGDAMSKDLKKRGFVFVGPTIMYSFMQAMGMVNDHATNCFRHNQLNPRQ